MIRIHVLFFAGLKDRFHREIIDLEMPHGTKAKEVLNMLMTDSKEAEKLTRSLFFAVNQSYVKPETELKNGDELVLIPPVAGG